MAGFVDMFIEPILWFIVAGIIFALGIWFSVKVKQAEPEARPVLSGIMVFLLGWGIVRFIETIRRYYVGSYYDIVDSNFAISGPSLFLRLIYVCLSWGAVAYFYAIVEHKIFEKKSLFILAGSAIAEATLNVILYLIAPNPAYAAFLEALLLWIFIFFIIAVLFPVILFAVFAARKFGDRVLPWVLLSIGVFLFVLGIAGDNPEAYTLTVHLPVLFIHYFTPAFVLSGAILMSIGIYLVYGRTED